MKRKFKTKVTKSKTIFMIKLIFILIIIYILLGIIFNGKIINLKSFLLNNSIYEIKNEESFITKLLDFDITSPKSIIDIALNTAYEDTFNYEESKSEYVIDTEYIENKEPIVYIYNSHQLEEYKSNYIHDYSIKPNVLMASYILKEKLDEKGIPSTVETNNIKKYLNDNNLKYNYSYVASKHFIEIKLKEKPSIKYLIDVHRDSSKIDKTGFTYEGKNYARILFVVGLDNPTYESNLSLVTELNKKFNNYYPGFSRGILKKSGKGVNGIYNQDISPNAMLIEVGGVDNTIEEANNTMDLISYILSEYIGEIENGNKGK